MGLHRLVLQPAAQNRPTSRLQDIGITVTLGVEAFLDDNVAAVSGSSIGISAPSFWQEYSPANSSSTTPVRKPAVKKTIDVSSLFNELASKQLNMSNINIYFLFEKQHLLFWQKTKPKTYIFASQYPNALLAVMYQHEFQTARCVVL